MKKGFTLVELAIVLVLIGLLIVGVLAGQELIIRSQLKTVTTDLVSTVSAIYSFKEKYHGFPGDLRNATSFWGISTNCSGTSSTGTCNGNGDDMIVGSSTESLLAIQQLALAGFIQGSYTGTTVGAGVNPIGVDLPISKFPNVTYAPGWVSGVDNLYVYSNRLVIGAVAPGTYTPWKEAFTAQQAYDIDLKIDDGKADAGKLIGNSGYSYYTLTNYCTTQHSAPFSYVLTDPTIACHIYYFF